MSFFAKKLILALVLVGCTFALCLMADESEGISLDQNGKDREFSIQEYPALHMTQLTLANGMRIVLKSTDDDCEFCVRLAALGGYASLPIEERASGELAASLVVESGVGDLSADKLSAYLYDHSIEMHMKIEPFTRGLDASLPEESLEPFFSLVQKTFTAPKFTREAFANVLSKKRTELAQKGSESCLDDILNLVPIQEKQAFRPLQTKDLSKADLKKAKQFFLAAFSDPADFVCIISGDIDVEKTKKLAIEYFSKIPKRERDLNFIQPSYSKAPKAIVMKIQNLPNCSESLVRLAYPLEIQLDYVKLEQLELICQVMETRLRNIVKSHTYDAKGVDVWYELPLYPSLEHPWLTIQFHVANDHAKPTVELVQEELKKACKKSLSQEEINLAGQLKQQSSQLWEHDNDYWIVLLSNHYLWGWDPARIAEKFKNPTTMDFQAVHSTLRDSLLIDQYTFSTPY
jgi:hypothetical protein